MADPFSLFKEFLGFGFKIKGALDKAKHNVEECRKIDNLLLILRAIAKNLQGSPKIMEDHLMRDTAKGLEKALQRASEFVAECKRKGVLRRAFNATDIAEKLGGVCLDVLLNMNALLLANGALNNSELAELKEIVAQLRADGALNNLLLTKILQILADLPQEVEKLVKDNQISSKIKDKRETKKTAVASSQNKNKGEAKETDVARPKGKIQKNKKLGGSTVVPDTSLPDGLDESASAARVVGQGSSTGIINKARSSISKSVDKAQSVGVSAAPFHPQKIISISKEPGETGGYKIDTCSSETSKLLEVYPQRLLFPKEPKNKETTGSGCPVTLTNRTNRYVCIWIKPINGQFTKPEIMKPHSTLVVYATMNMHAQPPKDTVKFEVLMIIVESKQDYGKLESSISGKLKMDSGFMEHVKKLKAEVYRAMLTPITCDLASCQIISRSIKRMTLVTSIDAHPTKPWIVTGHEGGDFSIWDYQKQETVMKLQVNEVPDKGAWQRPAFFQLIKERSVQHSVFSVKFTAEGKRLVVGDGRGYIYVYDSTNTKLQEVKKIRAYDKKSVNSLAAHPAKPYLLSSSAFSRNIKLWDWSENWKVQNFDVKPENTYYDGVHSVKFNPRDTNTFACVTDEDRVKVWNIKTSSLETTLKGPFVMADYFFTRGHQHLMVTLRFDSHNSEIWDLKTQEVVHTLSVSGRKMTWVACHPKLPILVTMLDDGTVCLWDASTYRLEKMVHITNSKCRDLVFVQDTNGRPRLAIAFKTRIAIMQVNLPIANTSNASG
ncbi:hypothetical protein CFC21_105654 [Triticum aestivum]|uniref:Uncharacterized protein n=2 Tax=Triticum aestivum TaxID=4565 RepID=A0A3B6ST33_WHEAT|nr:uncharacterized protein LOC123156654 [Triticum aestivum]XP_044430740.1 uncharacterized protein LOC123156654 [Triticum aestivum]XP_044430741.1 uncharacterized protein LOC123156654 [Triticum aestivum]XP_044430742.1 uncharacterized protein LOC123156654 [Triticum aestivum]KAF7104787.1 hypothetical protein CFC21_105654 [Triticum aestivum]